MVDGNLFFNLNRETHDTAALNSWGRRIYLFSNGTAESQSANPTDFSKSGIERVNYPSFADFSGKGEGAGAGAGARKVSKNWTSGTLQRHLARKGSSI